MTDSSPLLHYDPRMVYVTTRAFLFNGVQFSPGMEISSEDTGLPVSKMDVLLRTRFIRPDRPRETTAKVSAAAPSSNTASSVQDDVEALSWSEVKKLCRQYKVPLKGTRSEIRKNLRAAVG